MQAPGKPQMPKMSEEETEGADNGVLAGVGIHNNDIMEAATRAEIYEKVQRAVAFHLSYYRECPCPDCDRNEHGQPTALDLALLTGEELAVIRCLYENDPSQLEHPSYATTHGAAEGVVEFLIDKEPDKVSHSEILAMACEAGLSKEIHMIVKKFPDLARQPYYEDIRNPPLYPISLAVAKMSQNLLSKPWSKRGQLGVASKWVSHQKTT